VFKDKQKAVQLCVNRFDEDTKEAFIDLYAKVDPSVELAEEGTETEQEIHSDGES
jgi:hypothetical protein